MAAGFGRAMGSNCQLRCFRGDSFPSDHSPAAPAGPSLFFPSPSTATRFLPLSNNVSVNSFAINVYYLTPITIGDCYLKKVSEEFVVGH